MSDETTETTNFLGIDPEYNVTEEGIELYRSSINVKEMHVN